MLRPSPQTTYTHKFSIFYAFYKHKLKHIYLQWFSLAELSGQKARDTLSRVVRKQSGEAKEKRAAGETRVLVCVCRCEQVCCASQQTVSFLSA